MKNNVKPIPEGYHTITPSMTLKDSLKAIEFYKKAFSAKVLGVFPSPDGNSTMHAVMKIGDSIIMMGDENPNQTCKSAETMGCSPVSFYIYVPNVDKFFDKAINAGAEQLMPVDEMFWGDRCGTLKDPFGYMWNIATHISELSREEVEEGAKSFFAMAGKR
jgi:PhnB protein